MKKKKYVVTIAKYAVAFSILGFLAYKAKENDQFSSLTESRKDWSALLGAFALALTSVLLSFIRWHYLVQALGLAFRRWDAIKLGFIGYLFNFLTLGIVGGDALKAVFVSRQFPKRKTEVIATVVFDRAIGLLALFIVCSVGFALTDFSKIQAEHPAQLESIQWICWVAVALSVVGLSELAALFLLPTLKNWGITHAVFQLPVIGHHFERLFEAAMTYRKRPDVMILSMVMSFGVHMLNTLAVYLVATGLSVTKPDLLTHFVVVPISMLAGALPLPGGLGAFEAMLDFLYHGFSQISAATNTGFVVALGFRLITLLIAGIGIFIYLTSKREVEELVDEAEHMDEAA